MVTMVFEGCFPLYLNEMGMGLGLGNADRKYVATFLCTQMCLIKWVCLSISCMCCLSVCHGLSVCPYQVFFGINCSGELDDSCEPEYNLEVTPLL